MVSFRRLAGLTTIPFSSVQFQYGPVEFQHTQLLFVAIALARSIETILSLSNDLDNLARLWWSSCKPQR